MGNDLTILIGLNFPTPFLHLCSPRYIPFPVVEPTNILYGIFIVVISILFSSFSDAKVKPLLIDLSGEWRFSLDPGNNGISELWATKTLSDFVKLPGTTDENKKGNLNSDNTETTHLSREYTFRRPTATIPPL